MFDFPANFLEYFIGSCAVIYGGYTIYRGELSFELESVEDAPSTNIVMDGWFGTLTGSLILAFGVLCLIFPEESSMAVEYIFEAL